MFADWLARPHLTFAVSFVCFFYVQSVEDTGCRAVADGHAAKHVNGKPLQNETIQKHGKEEHPPFSHEKGRSLARGRRAGEHAFGSGLSDGDDPCE